jgi:small subunit ribosomal protein S17
MRTKQGVITSAKLARTVTVSVHRHVYHALYKKRYRRSKNFLVDTGAFTDLAAGDLVEITECRPLSKLKRFRVTEVIKRAPRVSEIAEDAQVESVMRHRKSSVEHVETSESTAQ